VVGFHGQRSRKWFNYRQQKWQHNLGRAITVPYARSLGSAWNKWRNWCFLASNADPTVNINMYRPPIHVYCAFLDFLLEFYKPDTVRSYLKRINTYAAQKTGEPIHSHLNMLLIKRTYICSSGQAYFRAYLQKSTTYSRNFRAS